ncbi:unnamed protein product, partial [Prorocentrum cordatum]
DGRCCVHCGRMRGRNEVIYRRACKACFAARSCAVCHAVPPASLETPQCEMCDNLALWCPECTTPEQRAAGLCKTHWDSPECAFCYRTEDSATKEPLQVSMIECGTESCSKVVRSCFVCSSHFKQSAALCDVCWKAAGSKCIGCGVKPARTARVYQHFCKKCFGEERLADLVRDESRKFLADEPRPQRLDDDVLLALAKPEPGSLPKYAETPEYLDPNHCRFCKQPWGDSHDDDKRRHLLEECRHDLHQRDGEDILQTYRRTVLERARAEGLDAVSPQVGRFCVAQYKHAQTDERYVHDACAVCCRKTPKCDLNRVHIPSSSSAKCPEWLSWSEEFWNENKETWYEQVDKLLSIEQYLKKFLKVSERAQEARESVEACSRGEPHELGFTKVEDAKNWVDRVRLWEDNLRRDMREHSVVSPGDPNHRRVLYKSAVCTDAPEGSGGDLRVSMCKECAEALSNTHTDSRGRCRPRLRMPSEALANGMWRGPDPEELTNLTYTECKVINLARVYVSVKRVLLDRASFARTSADEAPRYHQTNVVAYPQSPDAALTAIGLSPMALAHTLIVQFVGSRADGIWHHPDLQVSVVRLRAAFRWLCSSSWNHMEATRHHAACADSGLLHESIEELLDAYATSVGGSSGVPRELVDSATSISGSRASVQSKGPADCTEEGERDTEENGPEEAENAAVVNGGLADVDSLQLWTQVIKHFKAAQRFKEELAALDPADLSARAEKKRMHGVSMAQAIEDLEKLSNEKMRKRLEERARSESDDRAPLKITHETTFLSARTPNFWASCFVRLFPRGDCQETCPERKAADSTVSFLSSNKWTQCLLKRADCDYWRKDLEFVASVVNIFMRRDQMSKVEACMRETPGGGFMGITPDEMQRMNEITAEGLVAAAIAMGGDAKGMSDLLRNKKLTQPVRTAADKMQAVSRKVRGSAEERDSYRWNFRALQINSGCSTLFFTLNPHDIRSPLTVLLVQDGAEMQRLFSLNMSDKEAEDWMKEFQAEHPRLLHRRVAQDPYYAQKVFHSTVKDVIRYIFNCADGPSNLPPDGIAASEVPGVFGYVRPYLGVVEEQMRKALHIHMLVQILGFSHPDDIFKKNSFLDEFKRLYYYHASVMFRSQEAVAHHFAVPVAMRTTAGLPLFPVTLKQRSMIGSARVEESNLAQTVARGLDVPPALSRSVPEYPFFVGSYHGDENVSGSDWGSRAVVEIFSRSRKTGNHVCKPSVCHKGLLPVAYFKLSYHSCFGRCCNHDIQVLPRLRALKSSSPDAVPDEAEVATARAGLIEQQAANEFYCSSYSSKSAPHAEGLVLTLAVSLHQKEQDAKEAAGRGDEPVNVHEKAKRILHRLLSATNNRMHKGFPEMLSYLLQGPTLYSSHEFVTVLTPGLSMLISKRLSEVATGAETSGPSTAASPYSTKLYRRPFLTEYDYLYRPDELEDFPLYFYFAACEARQARPDGHRPVNTLAWHVAADGKRQFSAEKLYSREHEKVPLRGDPSEHHPLGPELYKYAYYVTVRLSIAWRIPVLRGFLPPCPEAKKDGDGEAKRLEDEVKYAVYVQLLFRPFRTVEDVLRRAPPAPWTHIPAEYYGAFLNEFEDWRSTQESIASRARSDTPPLSKGWWACRVCECLRNYDLVAKRHVSVVDRVPTGDALRGYPDAAADIDGPDANRADDEEMLMESDSDESPGDAAMEDDAPSDAAVPRASGREADPVSQLCGTVDIDLNELVNSATLARSRSNEAKYLRGFIEEEKKCVSRRTAAADGDGAFQECSLSARKSLIVSDMQQKFFKIANEGEDNVEMVRKVEKTKSDVLQQRIDAAMARIPVALERKVPLLARKSSTSVVEAALFLLSQKVLDIPDVGGINVKQARAFLWNALWLQDVMNREWSLDDPPGSQFSSSSSLADGFQLALMGPGGTGKTAVLRVTEALVSYFLGAESVRKCAPSNSAARLIGGDAIRAVCKLPFGNISVRDRKARLSVAALEKHRQRWKKARACFIDEVSMVSSDQLHASEVRIREAKDDRKPFGGLGMILSGDFLQLPPVDPGDAQKSLATPLKETGALDAAPENPDAKDQDAKRKKLADAAQGVPLWQRARHVVCLDVNIRAPGKLSKLLAEMRDGKGISSECWQMYLDRIMERNDQRLSEGSSPFSKYDWQFIVHRHKIRVHRSLVNAKAATSRGHKPLFIAQARDEAVHSKDDRKMPHVREELLRRASPRDTQSLPGILPLYVGMRLTFQEK